jgi:hypothetical protein
MFLIADQITLYEATPPNEPHQCILNYFNPVPIQFFCQPHIPQLLFVLGGKEVGGLLVIILQF